MREKESGFSLIELLITVAVLSVISGAALSLVYQSQFSYTAQTQLAEESQDLRSAMDLIIRSLRQAGSDPLEMIATPAVTILGQDHIQIAADVTGSVDSITGNPLESTGDPDGALNSIGELVTVRYDSSEERLYLNMGYGEAVLADNVTEFNLSFLDEAGMPTTVNDDIARVQVSMTGKTARTDLQTKKRNAISFSSEVFLRSKTQQIF
jgi:prepilin-type N-terminal cleavage/methylation domain-containing protein